MKSIHYIATVVLAYRMLIDDYYDGKLKDLDYYRDEIKKAENRLTSIGFLAGETTTEQQLYNSRSESPTKEFLGIVLAYDKDNSLAFMEQRNYFGIGDPIEIASPDKTFRTTFVTEMYDEFMNPLDIARHPLQKIFIRISIETKPYDMVRRVR